MSTQREKSEPCQATARRVCGACGVCQDFHFYNGNGCTAETCPLQAAPDAEMKR